MEAELCRMEMRMEAAEDEKSDMAQTMEKLCDVLHVKDQSSLYITAKR